MLTLNRTTPFPFAAFALALLVAGAAPDRAVAGGLFKKKGTLVAVPTAGASSAMGYTLPTATLGALPIQSSQISVFQVPQSTLQYAVPQVHYGVFQVPSTSWGMVAPQANPPQAQAAPSPTIHITVVEAGGDRPAASPTAQSAPSPQSGQVSVPQGAQAATVFYATPAVPSATPVQLFYVPPTHSCNAFCRH